MPDEPTPKRRRRRTAKPVPEDVSPATRGLITKIGGPPEPESRSQARRIAAQLGQPAPTFTEGKRKGPRPRSMPQLWPAETWPVEHYIREEMEAREWFEELLVKLMLRPPSYHLADMEKPLTEGCANRLERAFEIDAQVWLNIDREYWRCHKSGLYEEVDEGGPHLRKKVSALNV